jgi:type VII secretion protein EccB
VWSRRDQIQAYQFLRRRTVSAILVGDANHAESPTKRSVAAFITGAVVMVLMLAGFGIYGFLRPGSSTAWKQAGTIVQEKETGARYIYGEDELLHPVINYASARLVTGGGTLVRVSAASLDAVERGLPVGIPGAPDAIPTAKQLVADEWAACSVVSADAGPTPTARVVLVVGASRASSAEKDLESGAVVVRSDQELYVVADGRRMWIRGKQPSLVLTALGLERSPVIEVAPTWLDALPAGPDLSFIDVPQRGQASTAIPGVQARIGQVFADRVAGASNERYFILLDDGLAPIATTQARLLLGDPRSRNAYGKQPVTAREISPATLATAPQSSAVFSPEAYPTQPLQGLSLELRDDTALCARPVSFRDGLPFFSISLAFSLPIPDGRETIRTSEATSSAYAEEVAVPPGAGALVLSVPADDVSDGPLYLVTDQGTRHAIIGDESLKALGYADVDPVPVPASFTEMLVPGAALDSTEATKFRTAVPPGSDVGAESGL